MNPNTELDRLFAQVFPSIPKLAKQAPTDPVEAAETANEICEQGDCSDELE